MRNPKPIFTFKDGLEVYATTGDIEAFLHGGGVVFRIPRRDKYFWQFWERRKLHQKNFEVYTAAITSNILESYAFADLEELSACSQVPPKKIVRRSTSSDPVHRAQLLGLIVDIYGASSVDPTRKPEIVTPWELKNRWGELFGCSAENVPQLDVEDYLIYPVADRFYCCGCMNGDFLGRYPSKRQCLCAISDHMHKIGDMDANTFFENNKDELELISFDPIKYKNKLPFKNKKLPKGQWNNYIAKFKSSKLKEKELKKDFELQSDILKQRSQHAQRNARYNRVANARKAAKRAARGWRDLP